MAEELKALIDKINEEGVMAAEEKARTIESRAESAAEGMLEKARQEADAMIAEAKEKIARIEESSRSSLKQAGRDLIITLRKEIGSMLDRIILSHAHKALGDGDLAAIISGIVKEYNAKGAEGIVISLSKNDLEKIEKTVLGELKESVRKAVTLKSQDDIHGGFVISYDSGRSYYDFTDQALARYISLNLKPKLNKILDGMTA